jgi:inositol oxygenase
MSEIQMNLAIFGLSRAGNIHYNNTTSRDDLFNVKYVIDKKNHSHQQDVIDFDDSVNVEKAVLDVDAVIIASPTETHFDIIMLALNCNKHVFVEKPIVNNYDQIKTCFELAEKKNLILFVGYNRRFDPTIARIKDQVECGDIGFVNYVLTINRDYPYPSQRVLESCSGIFNDCASHDIDYVNWILDDKPISVQVCIDDHNMHENYNFDHVLINLKYSMGTIASINLSRVATSYDQRCEFYGTNGEIINNQFLQNARLSFPERYHDAFLNELDAFYECIIDNIPSPVTLDQCLSNYSIVQACEESVEKNKKITIKYGGKEQKQFRNYNNAPQSVINNYLMARKKQTMDFVLNMHQKYQTLDLKMEIWDILEDLNDLIDVSDPDCSHPNLYHAIQTAEMIRKDGHSEWMQVIGLLHDIGKIMYKKGCDRDGTSKKQQWAMVGDTFMLGCSLPKGLIYSDFNQYNPDMKDDRYNTKYGVYQPGCGLDNMVCSWGHDEYLYQILRSKKNPNSLPDKALYIIRFHSLYAYHDKCEYLHFQSDKDNEMLPVLQLFNNYDLYSKSDEIFNVEELKPYYTNLIAKFFTNSYLYI